MQQRTLRVGLIGYGAIGQDLSYLLTQRAELAMTLVGALVRHPSKLRPAASPKIVTSASALQAAHPEVVVEVQDIIPRFFSLVKNMQQIYPNAPYLTAIAEYAQQALLAKERIDVS